MLSCPAVRTFNYRSGQKKSFFNLVRHSLLQILSFWTKLASSWIRIRSPEAKPDPGGKLNVNSCGSGSEILIIYRTYTFEYVTPNPGPLCAGQSLSTSATTAVAKHSKDFRYHSTANTAQCSVLPFFIEQMYSLSPEFADLKCPICLQDWMRSVYWLEFSNPSPG